MTATETGLTASGGWCAPPQRFGDVPGHEFHGNQHTDSGGASRDSATGHLNAARDAAAKGDLKGAADHLDRAAERVGDKSTTGASSLHQAADSMRTGDTKGAGYHLSGAKDNLNVDGQRSEAAAVRSIGPRIDTNPPPGFEPRSPYAGQGGSSFRSPPEYNPFIGSKDPERSEAFLGPHFAMAQIVLSEMVRERAAMRIMDPDGQFDWTAYNETRGKGAGRSGGGGGGGGGGGATNPFAGKFTAAKKGKGAKGKAAKAAKKAPAAKKAAAPKAAKTTVAKTLKAPKAPAKGASVVPVTQVVPAGVPTPPQPAAQPAPPAPPPLPATPATPAPTIPPDSPVFSALIQTRTRDRLIGHNASGHSDIKDSSMTTTAEPTATQVAERALELATEALRSKPPQNADSTFPEAEGADAPDQQDDTQAQPAAVAGPRAFKALLAVEGEATGDRRYINPGALTWRDLPLPLLLQTETPAGGLGGNPHAGGKIAGRIDRIERDGKDIWGYGYFDPGENGQEAARLATDKTLRGISVDLDDVDASPGEGPDSPRVTINKARIMGAHQCPFQALMHATIEPADPKEIGLADEEPEVLVASMSVLAEQLAKSVKAMPESKALQDTGSDDGDDASDGGYTPAPYHADADETVKCPDCGKMNDTDASYCDQCGAKLAGRDLDNDGMATSPDNEDSSDATKGAPTVSAHPFMPKPGGSDSCKVCDRPESDHATSLKQAAITAAGATMSLPPESWFHDPGFTTWTPMTFSDEALADGRRRVFGHLAGFKQCHSGYTDVCVRPPKNLSYRQFNTERGATRVACDCDTAESYDFAELPTGVLTFGTSHLRNKAAGWQAALDHYERTGMAIADVVAGEDKFGPWVAGVTKPGVTNEQVELARGASWSGDWRGVNGKPELIAALGVNVPGYGVPRSEFHVKNGELMTLIASGAPDDYEGKKAGDPDDAAVTPALMDQFRVAMDEALGQFRADLQATLGADPVREALQPLAISTLMDALGTEDPLDHWFPNEQWAATKSDTGGNFGPGDYAHVPDRTKPSTWKLRLTSTPGGKPDPGIVGAAAAAVGKGFRGQKADIPAGDLPKVKSKIASAWKQANPDKNASDMPDSIKGS